MKVGHNMHRYNPLAIIQIVREGIQNMSPMEHLQMCTQLLLFFKWESL